MHGRIICIILLLTLLPHDAAGDLILFKGDGTLHEVFPDLAPPGFMQWEEQVGQYYAIDFTDQPYGTVLTHHYSHLGIHFLNPPSAFVVLDDSGDIPDGGGLIASDGIRFIFDVPQHVVGVDYWGPVAFALYLNGVLVGITPPKEFSNSSGNPLFGGLISDVPFDEVHLFRYGGPDIISIDNVYWGAPIPVPGALGLFALAALGYTHRRR